MYTVRPEEEHFTMAISEWTDQNLAEVIIIGGMVFCALSVGFNKNHKIHFRAHLMMFTSDPDLLLDHHVVPALG